MKRLITLILTAFLSLTIYSQSTCDSLFVEGIHVNPFNDNQLILHSNNTSSTEYYSYPSWQLLYANGEEVAIEQVNLFGMMGDVYHLLDLVQPLDYSEPSFTGQAVLWTGFEEAAVCEFDLEVFPWMVDEATTDPYGCVPISIEIHGQAADSGNASFSIANTVTDEYVLDGEVSFSAEDYVYESFGVACLDQNSCYQLYVNSSTDISNFNIIVNMGVGEYWQTYTYFLVAEIDSLGSVYLDPYGGNCNVSVNEIERRMDVYPNPISAGAELNIPAYSRGIIQWFNISGKLMLEETAVFNGRVQVPEERGLWVVVWLKEGKKKHQVVVVE